MTYKIAVLPGDGIGPEIVTEAVKLLEALRNEFGLAAELEFAPVGGAGYEAHGHPLPPNTLELARQADAVLLGAVGGPRWEGLERSLRPEQGLLGLRSELQLFSNLRPAILYPELTGGIYFGKPRGIRTRADGQLEGFNTLVYSESEIERIGRSAFEIARKRSGRLCSVDKANVLEVSELWRSVMNRIAGEFADVELSHMYVDNAAMQLVRAPKQFDVMVTGNMFGDILSDAAAMLTGSIGMLPSASLDSQAHGMYEPIHGSAPDIAGKGVANPLATILSVAMMMRYSLDQDSLADRIERAVGRVLDEGLRTPDIATAGTRTVGTREMGDAVIAALRN
jgi:3-isopropylmalate dehydrogenase